MELGSKFFPEPMGRDKLKITYTNFMEPLFVIFNIYKTILGVKFSSFSSILAL
jgi:hypothetical protein